MSKEATTIKLGTFKVLNVGHLDILLTLKFDVGLCNASSVLNPILKKDNYFLHSFEIRACGGNIYFAAGEPIFHCSS